MSISPTKTGSPRQIVDGLLAQDPAAFEALYSQLKSLKYFFHFRVGPDIAQDLYHELIMELAVSIRDGRLRCPDALYAFANVIARRKVNNARAKGLRETGLPDCDWSSFGDGHVNTERDYRAAEERRIALKILNAMRGGDREVLIRFYLEEQTPEQICRDLDLTATRFRLIKSRAKQRFTELCTARFAPRKPPSQAESLGNRPDRAREA